MTTNTMTIDECSEHYTKKIQEKIIESTKNDIEFALNCAWAQGYNTVLDACWNVLSNEDYNKVTEYLGKLEENG